MGWKVVQRRLGRAGGFKARHARQRAWDREHGEGLWAIGYVLDGVFVSQEDALETIYYQSYAEHFEAHPEQLRALIQLARELRNPHALATTGVDLQVPAIRAYLERNGLALEGAEVVDIGTWQGSASHPISVTLSPLQIRATGYPKMTLESFWQRKKVLAVWEED